AVIVLLLVALSKPLGAAPAEDGLFATFQIQRGAVSVGEFSCRLEYAKAPRTVANFVGLAIGSQPFVDFQSGHATRRPFYDGITFHRVVAGFVVQAGSPKGDGSDGPGYTFLDEFDATLRHDKAGVLSMANSGLNSNGSQFFITLAPTPWLNDLHSVFGEVLEGMEVVNNIQPGDVIKHVTIVRNGAAALAFDESAQALPLVADANPRLQLGASGFELTYAQPPNAEFFVFHSDTLAVWNRLPGREIMGVTPVAMPRDVSIVTAGKVMQFFNVARVQHAQAIYTPVTVTGRRLVLTDDAGFELVCSLSAGTTGNYSYRVGELVQTFPVSSYGWTQEANRGRLIASISGLVDGNQIPITQINVSLVFASAAGGAYGGNLINLLGQPLAVRGTFLNEAL
ncbi:MAG TPA: peptidylprolyl isomerase, partial [Verrucomicrobiae bacterium]|nr:peptidylprolyl isomerase [Verrucomicrobiae bacterium]